MNPVPSPVPARRSLPARPLSARAWVIIGCILLLPWLVVFPILQGKRPAPMGQVTAALKGLVVERNVPVAWQPLKPGPWGHVEFLPITLAVPDEFVPDGIGPNTQLRWVFTGFTRDRLFEFLRTVPLTDAQRHDILRPSLWQEEADSLVVSPSVETVLTLATNARVRIYTQLVASWDETSQRFAVPYLPGEMEALLDGSALPADVRALVLGVRYPRGDSLMLGDTRAVLAALPRSEDRRELNRVLSRHPTFLIRLRVDAQSDLDQLARYWGMGRRGQDLRVLLQSLARVPGGSWIDVAHLLPPMPRRRLYTYAFKSVDPMDSRRDCHWTSVNFYNDPPDDTYTDSVAAAARVESAYDVVTPPLRFGDVLMLVTRKGGAVHSVVYVADNIVFTKNGGHHSTPWMFTTLDEMLRDYRAIYDPDGGVDVRAYRLRADESGR